MTLGKYRRAGVVPWALAAATMLTVGAGSVSANDDDKDHKAKYHHLSPKQLELRKQFKQIDEGFRLFTEETFEGNGRTCATCHIPSEVYNIFPATIKKLSKKEKALVFAKNVPGLENKKLVRKRALFNIAGGAHSDARDPNLFNSCDDHPHDCAIFRGTMGIFGIDVTTENTANRGSPLMPAKCSTGNSELPNVAAQLPQLGWAGDGAPGSPDGVLDAEKEIDDPQDIDCRTHHGQEDVDADGSLRAFGNGAIAQHATRRLDRIAKTTACPWLSVDEPDAKCYEKYDFRFASNSELTAMADFQKWLGRRGLAPHEQEAGNDSPAFKNSEFAIAKLDFADDRINKGRDHYAGGPEFLDPTPGGPPNPTPRAPGNDFGAGCNGCHTDGGAKNTVVGGPPNLGQNIILNTEVELANADPGSPLFQIFGVALPHDEGAFPNVGPPGNLEGFNFQSLIESPRKKAWFHNHRVIGDFEEAIAFYTGDDFNLNGTGPAFTSLEGMAFGPCVDGTGAAVACTDTNAVGTRFPDGDGIDLVGGFLRSLSAYYGLRNCERLVTEAISRIHVYVSPKLAIQHCKFELADVKRVLKRSKLEPTPYKRVARKASKLSRKMEKAAYRNDIGGLKSVIDDLIALRNSIATVVTP